MSGLTAITPIEAITHYEVKGIPRCARPKAKLYPDHKKEGLKAFPWAFDYYDEVFIDNTGTDEEDRTEYKLNTGKISQHIRQAVFWTGAFVSIEVDIRVDKLRHKIQKVNNYAEQRSEAQRTYINKLGPRIENSLNQIPKRVLASKEFIRARKRIKSNQSEIKKINERLVIESETDKQEISEIKKVHATDTKNFREQLHKQARQHKQDLDDTKRVHAKEIADLKEQLRQLKEAVEALQRS